MNDLLFINQRKNQANNSTIGDIFEVVAGEWKWFSHIVEDDSTGIKGDKRIPASLPGKPYELKIHPIETPKTVIFRNSTMPYLEKFIEVCGIPGFDLVFFHVLNDEIDTEGCQGPNDIMGNNNTRTLAGKKLGASSSAATERFYSKVYAHLKAGGKAFYEVRDENRLGK